MVVPETQVTASVDTLYLKFFIILLVSVGTSALLITYLYRSFMEPINKLNISMKEVYNGNVDAYVELKEYLRRNEIYDMMVYYNSMLKRIKGGQEKEGAGARGVDEPDKSSFPV